MSDYQDNQNTQYQTQYLDTQQQQTQKQAQYKDSYQQDSNQEDDRQDNLPQYQPRRQDENEYEQQKQENYPKSNLVTSIYSDDSYKQKKHIEDSQDEVEEKKEQYQQPTFEHTRSSQFNIPQANQLKNQQELYESHQILSQTPIYNQLHDTTAQVIVDNNYPQVREVQKTEQDYQQQGEHKQSQYQIDSFVKNPQQNNENINQNNNAYNNNQTNMLYTRQQELGQTNIQGEYKGTEEDNEVQPRQEAERVNHNNQYQPEYQRSQDINLKSQSQRQQENQREQVPEEEIINKVTSSQQEGKQPQQPQQQQYQQPYQQSSHQSEEQKNEYIHPQSERIQLQPLTQEKVINENDYITRFQPDSPAPPRAVSRQIQLQRQILDSNLIPSAPTHFKPLSPGQDTDSKPEILPSQQNILQTQKSPDPVYFSNPNSSFKTNETPITPKKKLKEQVDTKDSTTCACLLF